jgi:plastocyanin
MSRVLASLLIALAIAASLAPALPRVALAEGMDGPALLSTTRVRGCGSGQQSVPAAAISGLPAVTIGIYDGFFLPAEVTVAAGTRVIWVNNGDRPHTTTAWNRWDSGVLMPGERCEAWFVTPGSYDYLSIVAADGGTMRGTVAVEGSLADVSGPMGSSGTMRSAPTMPGMRY